jgi:hypothetical protein
MPPTTIAAAMRLDNDAVIFLFLKAASQNNRITQTEFGLFLARRRFAFYP